jgi:hypothetical protein
MMKKTTVVANLFIFFFLFMGNNQIFADSAEVLPRGVLRANVTTNLYWPVDERFDPDGKEESVDTDFNTTLNSDVFPDLRFVELGFGMSPGSANIGRSVVDFEYKFTDLIFELFYGITDRLTVGAYVPYYWNKTDVKETRLDTRRATVGKNESLGTLAPLDFPGTVPLTTEDVQKLLGKGLDIGATHIDGFGYKRVETWSDSGVGDIEAGFRYQYLKTDNWRLAFTGGVRFPTGDIDDPDNLIDVGFGRGAYALLFRSNNDFTGIKNLVLNVTVRYDLYFSDKQEKRILSNVNNPLTRLKQEVEIDCGDIVELETSGTYTLPKGFSLSALYRYGFKTKKDDVSGPNARPITALEDETDWAYHDVIGEISYSTLPLFMKKKFPLPLNASVAYENVFAGKNDYYEQQLISFKLSVFF